MISSRFGAPVAAALFVLSMPAPGAAQTVKAGDLSIEQPWARATPGGAKVGGGYVRITNAGQAPDRLTGGSFALSARVEVHEMSMQNDVMRMKQMEHGLEIAPGATVELKPGGYHLMFMDLKEPLAPGRKVKGTLVFEKAGPVEVEYTVRAMGGHGGGHGAAPAQH